MSTLAQHAKRPLTRAIDMSGVSVKTLATRYADNWPPSSAPSKESPEREALRFYLTNHTMSAVRKLYGRHRPLPGEIDQLVDEYYADNQVRSLRMVYYLWLICTREARHFDLTYPGKHQAGWCFLKTFRKGSEDDAITAVTQNPPDMSVGDYAQFLYEIFRVPGWDSAFGGLKWAEIAEVFRDFVRGVLSAEMMLDTAFTLAHNNGPIFNKGYLYLGQDKIQLQRILDVQAAGRIPAMVAEGSSGYVTKDMQQYVDRVLGLGLLVLDTGPAQQPEPETVLDPVDVPDVPESKKFYVGPDEWLLKTERGE